MLELLNPASGYRAGNGFQRRVSHPPLSNTSGNSHFSPVSADDSSRSEAGNQKPRRQERLQPMEHLDLEHLTPGYSPMHPKHIMKGPSLRPRRLDQPAPLAKRSPNTPITPVMSRCPSSRSCDASTRAFANQVSTSACRAHRIPIPHTFTQSFADDKSPPASGWDHIHWALSQAGSEPISTTRGASQPNSAVRSRKVNP
jgi:hypothetical protein